MFSFVLKCLTFPIYMLLMIILVFVTVLNTKRLRLRYNFDSLPILMGLYILHVYFVLGIIKGGIYLLAPSSLLLIPIVLNFYKVQVIGITGNFLLKQPNNFFRRHWKRKINSFEDFE